MLALPIFPGRLQPSIVGASELNFRVRDGNGWTLAAISTNYSVVRRRFTLSRASILTDLSVKIKKKFSLFCLAGSPACKRLRSKPYPQAEFISAVFERMRFHLLSSIKNGDP